MSEGRFRLGNWIVYPKLNQLKLVKSDEYASVTPKIMQLILVLKQQREEHENDPAGIDELIEKVWPDRVVSDSSVYQAVAQLRKVLSADEQHDLYVERISGLGYRIATDISLEPVKDDKASNVALAKFPLYAALSLLVVVVSYFSFQGKKVTPDPHFESLSLASFLLHKREPEQIQQAKQLYLDVLALDVDNVSALNGLCNSYRLLTIYDTMTEIERDSLCQPLLKKAFSIAPNDPNILASMARQSFELGNFETSEQLFNQALGITKNEAMIWHWYGALKRSQNRIQEALVAHRNAFELSPNEPIILRGLAYVYLNNRDLLNARKYYERSVLIAPNVKNKPLYDLDFYPLDVTRAKSYLSWLEGYQKAHLKKYPVHKLSQILFLLSINKTELAVKKLQETLPEQVPTHFLLYAKAAMAWKLGNTKNAIEALKIRYNLAPEQDHFVMPYLVGKLHIGEYKEALSLFERHFPETRDKAIDETSLGQNILLAQLYKLNQDNKGYQAMFSKLIAYRQAHPSFQLVHELAWLDLIENRSEIYPTLTKLLQSGWLPDFNDSIFIEDYYTGLLIEPKQKASWLKSLRYMQTCIWQETNSELCSS